MSASVKDQAANDFGTTLAAVNGLYRQGFERWAFLPGMGFGDREKWWQSGGLRSTPHEGVDLCLFTDTSGRLQALEGSIQIPAMYDGVVLKTLGDFLGCSIFLRHACFDARGRVLHTVFGHTRPLEGLCSGQAVAQGQIIAEMAGPPSRSTPILPHLHVSAAWVPASMPAADLVWEHLGRSREIALFDPLTAAAGRWA